ncbi:hypothetical protein C6P40_001286 [Pichia californica]|uniref:non-specific serine/threonine protein kinase n=1 Tax=Pichia californica TaxID=460514 RepID=A0A9P6WJF8_9ASCO|nr:hypothetical protein C6P42_001339 [[Candida] californica]KAG0688210.1 hypothetical protein C6P40_001286 [[Candida] californica]
MIKSFESSSLQDFKPQSIIGYGKFSTVITANFKNSSNLIAIKIITKLHKNNNINNIIPISTSSTNYDTEINIIKKIFYYNHPNLLNYYIIFNTTKTIYIIQEFSSIGELNPSNFKYVSSSSNLSIEDSMLLKLIDILSAIQFLHSLNIIHRDIKPSNFLIFNNGLVKLTDFDTCYILTNDQFIDKSQLYSKLIGTPLFLPPELLTHSTSKISINDDDNQKEESNSKLNKKSKFNLSKKSDFLKLFQKSSSNSSIDSYNPFKLDLWSLGVTLHYLFYSSYPFYADNEFTLLHKIATSNPEIPNLINLSFKINSNFKLIKIINNLLIKLPFKRWSINNIINELNLNNLNNYKLKSFNPNNLNKSPILIKFSSLKDLSISNLTNQPIDEDFNSNFTSNLNSNSTQQFKFQLPIFMSPKDIKYSHLGNNSKLFNSNEQNLLNSINDSNLSSSSLPLNNNNNIINNINNNKTDNNDDLKIENSEDWETGNNYIKIMKKLESENNNDNDNNNNNNLQIELDKRSSIHTLPANLNLKSIKNNGLKHSEIINFKKFIKDKENGNDKDVKKKLINKPSYNAIDKQLANDYRLYTMDDYFDNL